MSDDVVASLKSFPGKTTRSASRKPAGMKTARALEGTGKTKWMDATRGYGFLVDVVTGGEVFVHYTALKRASRGQRYLLTNEIVEYTAEDTPRGLVATAVSGPGGGPLKCEALDDGWSDYGEKRGAPASCASKPPRRDSKRRWGQGAAARGGGGSSKLTN